jgi:hypothetical protein
MEEYFGEDYDDYPEEYLPYQVKKQHFFIDVAFVYFREIYDDFSENTFPIRQKTFFHPWAILNISERLS